MDNNDRALTGFWVESSLAISPKEQTEVMRRIFGSNPVCSESTQKELKQVMLVTEEQADISIYGKTGLGTIQGIVADAWFTGFAENEGRNVYFCIYLGETDGKEVSSAKAREIAIKIVSEQF